MCWFWLVYMEYSKLRRSKCRNPPISFFTKNKCCCSLIQKSKYMLYYLLYFCMCRCICCLIGNLVRFWELLNYCVHAVYIHLHGCLFSIISLTVCCNFLIYSYFRSFSSQKLMFDSLSGYFKILWPSLQRLWMSFKHYCRREVFDPSRWFCW